MHVPVCSSLDFCITPFKLKKPVTNNPYSQRKFICAQNMQKYCKSFLENKQPKSEENRNPGPQKTSLDIAIVFQCTGRQLTMPTPKYNFVLVKIKNTLLFQVSTDSKFYLLLDFWTINFKDHLKRNSICSALGSRRVCRMWCKMRTSYPAEYTETARAG